MSGNRKILFWDRLAINLGLDTEENVIRRETEMEERMRRSAEQWEADRARERAQRQQQTRSQQQQTRSQQQDTQSSRPGDSHQQRTTTSTDPGSLTRTEAMTLLGLAPGATVAQIRTAYHQKVMQLASGQTRGYGARTAPFRNPANAAHQPGIRASERLKVSTCAPPSRS